MVFISFKSEKSIINTYTQPRMTGKKMISMIYLIVTFLHTTTGENSQIPEWKDLECQVWQIPLRFRFRNKKNILGRSQVSVFWCWSYLGGRQAGVWALRRLAGSDQRPRGVQLPPERRNQTWHKRRVLDWWKWCQWCWYLDTCLGWICSLVFCSNYGMQW